jgi:hypothetical protein
MSAARLPKTLPHTCECDCFTCKKNKTGIYAQRAALHGDKTAAQRLSPAVYAFLVAERASRREAWLKAVST